MSASPAPGPAPARPTPPALVLDPVDRLSEILFGLIMALSVTCTLSASSGASATVRSMLWASLGCNLAWGVVDGLMYLLTTITQRGHGRNVISAVRAAATPEQANKLILDEIPDALASGIGPAELKRLRQIAGTGPLPDPPRLHRRDLVGAVGVAGLVCGATIPVSVPFMVSHDPQLALRVSNGIALLMLFGIGWGFGKYAGAPPWRAGLSMIALGAVCVGVTIALGG
jgi:hypothetical protein